MNACLSTRPEIHRRGSVSPPGKKRIHGTRRRLLKGIKNRGHHKKRREENMILSYSLPAIIIYILLFFDAYRGTG